MPVDPKRYPKDWPRISQAIRGRSEGLCECTGECGEAHFPAPRCGAPNGGWIQRLEADAAIWRAPLDPDRTPPEAERGWSRPIRVVLTVAHLDHGTENNDPGNLRALCQRCHLLLDREQHAASRRASRDAASGQGDLFGAAGRAGARGGGPGTR